MTDAATEQSKPLVLFVNDAVMLVPPVPGSDRLVAQDGRHGLLQIQSLLVQPGERLVMREQDHFSISFLFYDGIQPGDLPLIEVMVAMGRVESDQQPVGILQGEIAGRLTKLREDRVKIRVAAGVHFVIAI